MDEIPEALRDRPSIKPAKERSLLVIVGGVVGLIMTGLISFFMLSRVLPKWGTSSVPQSSIKSSPSSVSQPVTANPSPKLENILGHLPYQEAPASELKPVTSDGRIRLRQGAAEKFQQMQAAARANGVNLTLISGFRSVKEQEYLFFGVKEQRNQETKKRAEVSAPPRYSEHHTGYAVDIGDARAPGTNLSVNFENTAAFRWLKNNAARYSFELSFPPNNPQGVSYEPWHWRYVGDSKSLETFYKAQQLVKTREQGTKNK